MTILFVLIIGLVTGSFVSMLTYRTIRGLNLSGRSFCDQCRAQIRWYENIPLLSYFLLNGKCRSCQKNISFRYPLIESFTSLLFLLCYILLIQTDLSLLISSWVFSFKELSLLAFATLLLICISLVIIDIERKLLPDRLLQVLAFIVLVFLLLSPAPQAFSHLLWGFLSFTFFLTIYLLTQKRGMGFGDVKLSFLLGSLLGFPGTLVWLFLSFLSGSIIGVILMLFGKIKIGKPLPFGPYLILCALVTFFFGDVLFVWYMSML